MHSCVRVNKSVKPGYRTIVYMKRTVTREIGMEIVLEMFVTTVC